MAPRRSPGGPPRRTHGGPTNVCDTVLSIGKHRGRTLRDIVARMRLGNLLEEADDHAEDALCARVKAEDALTTLRRTHQGHARRPWRTPVGDPGAVRACFLLNAWGHSSSR